MIVEITCLFIVLLFALGLFFRYKKSNKIVFFHPNCLDGGGGERVLWEAIKALHSKIPNEKLYIFSENATKEAANKKILNCFKIQPPENLDYINVGPARFLTPGYFKRLTLIRQAISSMYYGFKCLFKCVPSIIIDTTGAPFASIIWKLFGGCTVIQYIHYPFISTDMLLSVKAKDVQFNNDNSIAKSNFLTNLKTCYYSILCYFYSLTSYFTDIVMVNSSWTSNHIRSILFFLHVIVLIL